MMHPKPFIFHCRDFDTLIDFAKQEDANGNQDNRILFLKLSVVAMVTKFQVFVETILKEFLYAFEESQHRIQ